MRKHILLSRIKTLESQLQKKQPRMPITYFDEKLGMTMQIVGNGLALPLPMDEGEWLAMVEKYRVELITQKHSGS